MIIFLIGCAGPRRESMDGTGSALKESSRKLRAEEARVLEQSISRLAAEVARLRKT
jgi:hypothetical protein